MSSAARWLREYRELIALAQRLARETEELLERGNRVTSRLRDLRENAPYGQDILSLVDMVNCEQQWTAPPAPLFRHDQPCPTCEGRGKVVPHGEKIGAEGQGVLLVGGPRPCPTCQA